MRAHADQPLPSTVQVMPMRRRHVRDVMNIERQVYPRPWSAALFFSEIAQRKSRVYLVATDGRELLGYGGMAVHLDEAHVTTIAVDPAHQKRGLGARILYELVTEARSRAARSITLEVRVANWPAQRLYSWFGFRPVGIRRNYYAETGEDALVMWVDDLQGRETAERLVRIRSALAEKGLAP